MRCIRWWVYALLVTSCGLDDRSVAVIDSGAGGRAAQSSSETSGGSSAVDSTGGSNAKAPGPLGVDASEVALDAGSFAGSGNAESVDAAADAGRAICALDSGAQLECCIEECFGDSCVQFLASAGAPTEFQVDGDCRQRQCDGAGHVLEVPADDPPLPDPCVAETACSEGLPLLRFAAAGTPCGEAASECSAASTCDASGTCISDPLPAGHGLAPEGCIARECDGEGGVLAAPDDSSCPAQAPKCQADGSCSECSSDSDCTASGPCMNATCVGGSCSETPREAGTVCGAGRETCSDVDRCDGQGTCRLNHLPVSEVLDDPQPGDCRGLRCDGQGGTEPFALDSDVPDDDDPLDCRVFTCRNGAPSEATRAAGEFCSDGLFCTASDRCNSSGACIGTGDPCPGDDGGPDCSDSCDEATDTCTANDARGSSCGAAPRRCNGSGSCVSCLADADCPGYGGGGRTGFCRNGSCLECLENSDCSVTCEQGVCDDGFCDNLPLCSGSQ